MLEAGKLELNFENAFFRKAFAYSAVFALLCWLFLGLLLENIALSAFMALPCFLFAFLALLYYPRVKRKRHAAAVEAELPFCLMAIAIELDLGMQFEKALGHAALGKGPCARELKKAVEEIESQGASVQEALRHFAERLDSRLCKRAAMQLVAAFEQGSGGESIKRIASEVLARQRIESRLFSGKLVVFSLLFIAVSAIVPALFQSFSIVGSILLQMHFNAVQLFLIIAAGFPLLDLAVLLLIRAKTPVFLGGN